MKVLTINVTDKYHNNLTRICKHTRLTPDEFIAMLTVDTVCDCPKDIGSFLREFVVDAIVYDLKKDATAICSELNSHDGSERTRFHVVRAERGWMVTATATDQDSWAVKLAKATPESMGVSPKLFSELKAIGATLDALKNK